MYQKFAKNINTQDIEHAFLFDKLIQRRLKFVLGIKEIHNIKKQHKKPC